MRRVSRSLPTIRGVITIHASTRIPSQGDVQIWGFLLLQVQDELRVCKYHNCSCALKKKSGMLHRRTLRSTLIAIDFISKFLNASAAPTGSM